MNWFDIFQKVNKRDIWTTAGAIGLSIVLGLSNFYVFQIAELIGFDFATSVIPGWHTTIYLPLFILSRIGTILIFLQLILVLLLLFLKRKSFINLKVIESINFSLLIIGIFTGINYLFELFVSWYSGYIYEQFAFYNRVFGTCWWSYFFVVLINMILLQLFWFKKIRQSPWATFTICLSLNIGSFIGYILTNSMSMARDYLPSSWSYDSQFSFISLLIPFFILLTLCYFIFFIANKSVK